MSTQHQVTSRPYASYTYHAEKMAEGKSMRINTGNVPTRTGDHLRSNGTENHITSHNIHSKRDEVGNDASHFVTKKSSCPESGNNRLRKITRRTHTVSGVTNEARLLLEQYLTLRNASYNESRSKSPRTSIRAPGREESVDGGECKYLTDAERDPSNHYVNMEPMYKDTQPTSVIHTPYETIGSTPSSSSVTPQKKNDNIILQKSKTSHVEDVKSSVQRSDSRIDPSGVLKRKVKSNDKISALLDESSSDIDEKPDTSTLNRKKKSVFQRATERIRESFRRQQKKPSIPSTHVDHSPFNTRTREDGKAEKESKQWMSKSFRKKKVDKVSGEKRGDAVEKSKKKDDKSKETGIFTSFQQRIGSMRIKRSPSKSSNEDVGLRSLTKKEEKLIKKYAAEHEDKTDAMLPRKQKGSTRSQLETGTSSSLPDPFRAHPLPVTSRTTTARGEASENQSQGHHSARKQMKLEGLVGPAVMRSVGRTGSQLSALQSPDLQVDNDESDGFSGAAGWSEKVLPRMTSKTFGNKSDAEKDELLDEIASTLQKIGDKYNVTSPTSPDKEKGSSTSLYDITLVLAEQVVSNLNYNRFQRMVIDAIGDHSSGVQLALIFRMTRHVVEKYGSGTPTAKGIETLTIKYFEEHLAEKVVELGGFETMVEDSDFDVD